MNLMRSPYLYATLLLTLLAAGCEAKATPSASASASTASAITADAQTGGTQTGGTQTGDPEKDAGQPKKDPGTTSQPGKKPAAKSPWKPKGDPVAGKRVAKAKCQICHKIDGKSVTGIGPEMNLKYRDFVAQKMSGYPQRVAALKIKNREIYQASKVAIDGILAIKDMDQKIDAWLRQYMKKPTFDRVTAKGMTAQRLSKKQMDDVIAFVLSLRSK